MSTDPSKPCTLDIVVQRQLDTLSTGNGAYLETFLKTAKAAGFEVRVVFAPWRSFGNRPWSGFHPRFDAVIDTVVWPSAVKLGSNFWSTSPRVWFRFVRRALKEAARKLGLEPYVKSYLATPLDAGERKRVEAVVSADPADIVVAEYSALGPVLAALPNHVSRAALMHDLMSVRCQTFIDQGLEPDFEVMSLDEEADLVRDADLMIYASANELEVLGPLLPKAEGVWLRPEPPHYDLVETQGAPRVVFIGTRHAANTDTLNHFVDDIWPLVLRARPDTEFWVVGSIGQDLSEDRRAQAGVKVLGRVDDLASIGGAASVGVSPTRLASGVSIKVAEYLMLGMRCIASTKALEGFGEALHGLVRIEDTPTGFADAVVAALDDAEGRAQHAATAPVEAARILSNDDVGEALLEFAQRAREKT